MRAISLSAVVAFSLVLTVSAQDTRVPPTQSAPTFSKDVAPILERSCQNCHRPASIAPMSLLTYKEARPWARSIKEKVVRRQMPPWHIDRNVGITKFKDDPSLTDQEIATIAAWVDQGAPEGNPADLPSALQFSDLDKWHIGPPARLSSLPPGTTKRTTTSSTPLRRTGSVTASARSMK